MFIDDWPTQATRSLWCMLQEEYQDTPQILQNVLGGDYPPLHIAAKRLRTWLEEKRLLNPSNFDLEQEMISCALDEVHWSVLTHRIAKAINVPVKDVPDFIICTKCQQLLCQMCLFCVNPSCENAHEVDCLSESTSYQLGPILFDFAERKLAIRVGETEIPISRKEYKRLYIWLDIRKNG